ncbi:MAG: sigma-70 family RNA polymerase sigma factor [Christensenellales bacterium]|jgi:RNA polymerase sigma-B factor
MCETARRTASDAEPLLSEFALTGDPALRERIVEMHLNIAAMVAARFSGRGVDYDDLYQVASLALFKAVGRYDPDRGVKFATFATPTMIGEVKNYFRDRARVIRLPRNSSELIRAIENAIAELSQELFRQPTPDELAERMGVSVETVLEGMDLRGATRPASLDSTSDADESDTPLSAYLGFEERGFTDFERADMLSRAMETLTDQQREIIRYRFYDGLSQRDVAGRLGISQMSVSRAERRALQTLRSFMEKTEE